MANQPGFAGRSSLQVMMGICMVKTSFKGLQEFNMGHLPLEQKPIFGASTLNGLATRYLGALLHSLPCKSK